MLTDPHCLFLGGDFRHHSNFGWSSSRLSIPGSTTTPNGGARSSWSSTDRSSLSAWMGAVIASGAVTSSGWIGCHCAPCTAVDTRPPCWSPFRGNLPGLTTEFPLMPLRRCCSQQPRAKAPGLVSALSMRWLRSDTIGWLTAATRAIFTAAFVSAAAVWPHERQRKWA